MENKIKIALADDELLIRQGLKAILESIDTIDVVFDAKNGQHLIDLLMTSNLLPEIVITDL